MKKSLFLIPLALLFGISTFAFDYGFLLEDELQSTDEAKVDALKDSLENDATATMWIRVPLSKDGVSYFITEGYFNHNWKNASDETDKVLDLSLLKLSMTKKMTPTMNFIVNAGRFTLSDTTGVVFSQPADGLMTTFSSSAIKVNLYGGYTGLLNAKSTLYSTQSDAANGKSDVYVCDDPYLIAESAVTLPSLFLNQTLSVEFFSAWDLEDDYNRMYFSGALNGPISSLFYVLTSTAGISKLDSDSDWEIANYTKLSLSKYFSKMSSSLSLAGTYASGSDSSFDTFKTFTAASASIAGHSWSSDEGLFKLGMLGTIKPVSNLLLLGSFDTLFIPTDDFSYDGLEWKVSATWQILSDVQCSTSITQFIPEADEDSTVELTLKATISL